MKILTLAELIYFNKNVENTNRCKNLICNNTPFIIFESLGFT